LQTCSPIVAGRKNRGAFQAELDQKSYCFRDQCLLWLVLVGL
jgi:hypothetical protein